LSGPDRLTGSFASHRHAVLAHPSFHAMLAVHHPALHAVLRHHLLLAGIARVRPPVHTRVVRHLRCRVGSRRNNRYAGQAGLP
jgi:hypothetical protein